MTATTSFKFARLAGEELVAGGCMIALRLNVFFLMLCRFLFAAHTSVVFKILGETHSLFIESPGAPQAAEMLL